MEVLGNDTPMNTNFFCLLMGRVQDSGAAIADRAVAPNGKYTYSTPECSHLACRYNSQLLSTIGT